MTKGYKKTSFPAFQEYWEEQIKEIAEMNITYSFVEKPCFNPKAKYYDLYFTGVSARRLHAKYICPIQDTPAPIVFDFHDDHKQAQGWFHLTRYIALGYAVVAMDNGGFDDPHHHNHSFTYTNGCLTSGIEDGPDTMYYRNTYLDAYIVSNIMLQREGIDTSKMIAFGRGEGGAIALALSALQPKITKCSMEYPTLCDIRSAYKNGASGIYEELKEYFRMCDPMHIKEDEIFRNLSYIDMLHFAPLVKCEVLLATGAMDQQSPPMCQERVYREIGGSKKHLLFPKHGHELINAFEDENLKFMKVK